MSKNLTYLLMIFLSGFLLLSHSPVIYGEPPVNLAPMKYAPKVDQAQIACLAQNIYYEAGGESILGQAAVARVVMNRIRHGFGKTPCEVVYQAHIVSTEYEDGEVTQVKVCQFHWVCNNVKVISRKHPAFMVSEKIAYDVLTNDAYKEVIPKTTLFFHSVLIQPNWAYRQVQTIGNHIFYARKKQPKPLEK